MHRARLHADRIRRHAHPHGCWLTGPTCHGTWWHYPPLELGLDDLPAYLVYEGVSGKAIRDHLLLSFRVPLARNPDRYMKGFWAWLSKL